MTYSSAIHVSIAGQQPTSTHPCLHCWPAPTQHTPMSPLLASTHPAHTHVSIAGQHPPSTHPALHCCSAPSRHAPMSPWLLSTHHNECALAGMKIPRVVPNFPEMGSLTKVTWPRGLLLTNLLENRAGRANKNNNNNNPAHSGPRKPFRGGAPHSDHMRIHSLLQHLPKRASIWNSGLTHPRDLN